MPAPRQRIQVIAAIALCVTCLLRGAVAAEKSPVQRTSFSQEARSFFQSYCLSCHGTKKQEAELRLDELRGDSLQNSDDLATWAAVLKQLETGQMPPSDAPQPPPARTQRFIRTLRNDLKAVGAPIEGPSEAAFPNRGNYVDHDTLFRAKSSAAPATPARIWRLSPYAYMPLMDSLTGGPLMTHLGPGVGMSDVRTLVVPFGLTSDPGFRDYAFRYKVSGSETQQLAMNAKVVVAAMLTARPKWEPPQELTSIAAADGDPTEEQLRGAVSYVFRQAIYREPTAEELSRYSTFVAQGIERFGNREGLAYGLVPVLLHPAAIFRSELGSGPPDQHGRVRLAPLELAVAIAYALTDERPDGVLLAASRDGHLQQADDVRREVQRLLDDADIEKPRILRFFREYFDYPKAPDVFKDAHLIKAAGLASDPNTYEAGALVRDTDMLVEHVLAQDRDVLRELLTTDKTFIGSKRVAITKNQATKYFIHNHYSSELKKGGGNTLLTLPPDQRAGILTQPSWLIAHSANTENHAIHRGKWIRERLLGGFIPDTPITVEAKLPDDVQQTLRQRMHVTREEYCYKCHVSMDPLGLPFEIYNHFGQFRTTELGKPVDASGEIVASGDPALDGKVEGALELIRRLANSDHVHQVFVRHAFRYWLGRNETVSDAPTLQAAYQAYRQSGGSMKALITSLLTSDSFIYRVPETRSPRP